MKKEEEYKLLTLKNILYIVLYLLVIAVFVVVSIKLIGNMELRCASDETKQDFQTNFYLIGLPVLIITYLLNYLLLEIIFEKEFSIKDNLIISFLMLNLGLISSVGLLTPFALFILFLVLLIYIFPIGLFILLLLIIFVRLVKNKRRLLFLFLMTLPTLIIFISFSIYYQPVSLYGICGG